jgi:NTE family protein
MTTAFVLSGGGSLGAVQVGMLQALDERQIVPDIVIGTSAGALNAAYLAGHGTGRQALDRLAASWIETRRSDVFSLDPRRHLMALGGARPSLFADRGLRRLIAGHLNYSRLEDAPIEVHVIATDLLSGREIVLSRGDALTAVLASTAIPGILPPVLREGLTLVDGGLADNAAISVAVGLGAKRVFVLPTGYACALTRQPTSALAVAMQSLGFLIQQRLIADVAYFAERVDLNLLPPLCPLAVSPTDFRHARSLIDRAHAASAHWIENGGLDRPDPARFLSLHRHKDAAGWSKVVAGVGEVEALIGEREVRDDCVRQRDR